MSFVRFGRAPLRSPAMGIEISRFSRSFGRPGLMCLACFVASLALRPVCHSLVQRFLSWIALEVRAAGWSLAIGTLMVLVIDRFTLGKPEPVELLEACAKTSVLLFLWCNLYFSIKQSQRHSQERERLLPAAAEELDRSGGKRTFRFTVRTGPRILVVPADDVAGSPRPETTWSYTRETPPICCARP